MAATVPDDAPDFVKRVTARLMAGDGDLLPVSALPVDGTFPTGTAKYEKRSIAKEIPIWDPDICIDCGKCAIVCPHATIRMKVFEPAASPAHPGRSCRKDFRSKDIAGHRLTIQVAPDDCTGCGVCVDVCPAKSQDRGAAQGDQHGTGARAPGRRASRLGLLLVDPPARPRPAAPRFGRRARRRSSRCSSSPGACAGCGETPYLKLVTQLFGDRMLVANATGCSSIYGGNLPTTPWSVNHEGRGPAWNNSLFEDNAEFGLGMRLGLDAQHDARARPAGLAGATGRRRPRGRHPDAPQEAEAQIRAQRERVGAVEARADAAIDKPDGCVACSRVADTLVRQGVWIIGGDGWAYDIGFGGLDHVLSTGRNVNILVLDTEVYSNTGGQASKATPRGAVAKFAAVGQAHRQEGSRRHRPLVRQRVRRAGLDGRQRPPDDQGPARSRRLARAFARDRLLDLHRARHRHVQVDDPPEGCRPLRLLAAVPVPAVRGRRRPAVQARLANRRRSRSPSSPAPRRGSPFSAARIPTGRPQLAALAQADVDERWRYYTQLAAMQRTIPHAEAIEPEVESDAGYRYQSRRPSRVTDLSTSYLGLALRSPHRRVGRRPQR